MTQHYYEGLPCLERQAFKRKSSTPNRQDSVAAIFKTFEACGPFAPCTTSNSTLSPSFKVLNPSPCNAE